MEKNRDEWTLIGGLIDRRAKILDQYQKEQIERL